MKDKSNFLNLSTHIGGTGNLQLNQYKARLKREKTIYKKELGNLSQTIAKLLS